MSVTEPRPLPAQELSGYAELTAEIRSLGLLRRRPVFYAGLLAANLLALGSSSRRWCCCGTRGG